MRAMLLLLAVTLTSATVLPSATVPATVVAAEGDAIDMDVITSLGAPFTNSVGQVGFTGNTATSNHFVWFDTGPIWSNSGGMGLSGAEGTMGVGDAGQFIYSPSVDGDDAVWTQDGALLVDGDPAPDFPGQFNSFNSRPTLLPNGTAYWIAGLSDTAGGSSTARVLYRSDDTATPVITKVVAAGDMVDGFTVGAGSGVDFDYDVSDDDSHLIQVLLGDTGSTATDGLLVVDSMVIARESLPAAGGVGGENWDNFDNLSINNDGDFLFSGDTDGATGTDEFIAVNGTIAVREGDMIDGETLGSSVSGLSINNQGTALFIWNTASTETLFIGPADDLSTAEVLLKVGDEIDVDDDGVGDFTINDFNASGVSGPGVPPVRNGTIFVEVDMDSGAGEIEAIIRLSTSQLPFEDGFESGDTSAWTTTVP